MKTISFDSTSLNTGNYTVRRILHDTSTPRDLYMYELTREGGAELVNTEWKPKKIIVEGTIRGTTIEDLEANIDTFKQLVSGKEKNLDVQYETGTRRYVATAQIVQIERDYYHLNYAPYTIEFMIPSGDGKDIATSTYATSSIVANTLQDMTFTIYGTKNPKYQIELFFNSSTSVTSVSVNINGDTITVDEAISAGQILIIDAINKKVTLDGTEKRYTGLFPRLQLGTNNYRILMSSVSHSYDVTVIYTKTYL